jgi:YegS/Rv2252/BmrU family lipid kinase
MKTILIVNPEAGKRVFLNLYLPQVLKAFERQGVSCQVFTTRYSGHATRIVRRHRQGLDCVTVFGGDGTIREVVKGLGEAPLPVGIIPFGTVNVLALELGLSFNPLAAAATVLEGHTRKIDVGYMNQEPFLLMVSSGIDALAVHNVDLRAKRMFGRIAYLLSAVWSAFNFRVRRVWISIPETGVRDCGYLAIIANSRYYAGPYKIAEKTRIDDGILDVLLFKRRSIGDTLLLLAGILIGRHRYLRDVVFYRGRVIEVESRRPQKMQMDGDKAPPAPARVWVRKRFLPVIVPRRKTSGLIPR